MKKAMPFILVFSTAVILQAAEIETTLLDETFPAAGPVGTWYSSSAASNVTSSTGSLTLATGTSSSFLINYFAGSGSPVSLAIGDTLTVKFDFKINGVTDTAGGLRIGIFNSGGNRTTESGKGPGSTSYTVYNEYAGYAAFVNAGSTSGSPLNLRERDGTNDILINGLNSYTKLGSDGGTAGALLSNTTYSGTFTLTRLESGLMSVTFSVAGTGLTLTREDATDNFTFDTFVVSGHSGAFTSITLEGVKITTTTTAVPEPGATTLCLGGLAALAMLGWRRLAAASC